MTTRVKEIRQNRSRKEVINPDNGHTYIIRKLCQIEFSRAGISGFIALGDPIETPKPGSAEEMQVQLNGIRYTVEMGLVDPPVFTGPEAETPEDMVHISYITEDVAWLQTEILAFSGLSEQNKKDLEAYAKKKTESPSLTLSPNDTVYDPVNC
jgi:hypothetical protein